MLLLRSTPMLVFIAAAPESPSVPNHRRRSPVSPLSRSSPGHCPLPLMNLPKAWLRSTMTSEVFLGSTAATPSSSSAILNGRTKLSYFSKLRHLHASHAPVIPSVLPSKPAVAPASPVGLLILHHIAKLFLLLLMHSFMTATTSPLSTSTLRPQHPFKPLE